MAYNAIGASVQGRVVQQSGHLRADYGAQPARPQPVLVAVAEHACAVPNRRAEEARAEVAGGVERELVGLHAERSTDTENCGEDNDGEEPCGRHGRAAPCVGRREDEENEHRCTERLGEEGRTGGSPTCMCRRRPRS